MKLTFEHNDQTLAAFLSDDLIDVISLKEMFDLLYNQVRIEMIEKDEYDNVMSETVES